MILSKKTAVGTVRVYVVNNVGSLYLTDDPTHDSIHGMAEISADDWQRYQLHADEDAKWQNYIRNLSVRPLSEIRPDLMEDWQKYRGSSRKVAGPDTMGAGISPMGGGQGMSGPGGAGGANPTYTAGPSIAAPDGIGSWQCKFPNCRRHFVNGGDLRDHLWEDHDIKDIG